MIRYLFFFVLSFLTIILCLYLTDFYISCSNDPEGASLGRKHEMMREAELVSYFCLSKRPPVIGKVSIPRAWESALHASIQIFDNTGEVGSSFPELGDRADEFAKLTEGEGIYVESDEKGILAFRPKQSPEWFVVLAKPLDELEAIENAASGSSCKMGGIFLMSLLGALVVTLLARFTLRLQPAPSE